MTAVKELVNAREGLVNRRIFSDPEIYQRELEQIFGRCWLFLGHESQMPNANDFIAGYMGEDPVLLTRDGKGKLHGFLNMCTHRGNRVCRADKGNAASFMCTYHGWTFDTAGKLVGVPGYKEAYFEELDRSQWGLVEVAQIDSYKGLIFATWDREAPTLREYLGDMAWYLDVWLDRREGGIEIIGGLHKWTLSLNWKLYAENLGGDGYHFPLTHASVISARLTGQRAASSPYVPQDGQPRYCFDAGNGHEVVTMGHSPREAMAGQKEVVKQYFQEHQPELEQRLGAVRAANVTGIGNVFPNLAYVSSNFTIKLFHPKGPQKTEAWNLCFVDKSAPKEVRDAMRTHLVVTQGPAGLIEEDDMGNLIQCTASGKTTVGKRRPMNYQLGLGREAKHEDYPGRIGQSPGEGNQRAMYTRWAELMDAASWSEISMTRKASNGL